MTLELRGVESLAGRERILFPLDLALEPGFSVTVFDTIALLLRVRGDQGWAAIEGCVPDMAGRLGLTPPLGRLVKDSAPWPKLANEKPQGETVASNDLVRT